jgi:hypothetical protein
MVLLENFGAEPLTVKLQRLNCGKLAGLWRRPVAQPMMPGIPKFRKESHPERVREKRRPIYSNLLRDARTESKPLSPFPLREASFSVQNPSDIPRHPLT